MNNRFAVSVDKIIAPIFHCTHSRQNHSHKASIIFVLVQAMSDQIVPSELDKEIEHDWSMFVGFLFGSAASVAGLISSSIPNPYSKSKLGFGILSSILLIFAFFTLTRATHARYSEKAQQKAEIERLKVQAIAYERDPGLKEREELQKLEEAEAASRNEQKFLNDFEQAEKERQALVEADRLKWERSNRRAF